MTTETSQSSQSNSYVFDPPTLPAHLSGIYGLKPIVGHPSDQDVKAIHAAIRAVNAEAQIPHLYNPDLSVQLSQHLFNVQMVICRKAYPMNLFPGEHTYTPPSLPAHIPITLESVAGNPTRDQLKAVQNAIRVAESLGSSPLFDPDLNMDLSQHLFNLQFARYIQGSTLGQFTPKSEEPRSVPQDPSADPRMEIPHGMEPVSSKSDTLREGSTWQAAPNESVRIESCVSSRIMQQGEDIKELMSDSKRVLENMNRVLIAIQRGQAMVGVWGGSHHARANPVNEQGITAAECGLPQLVYWYNQSRWSHRDGAIPALNDAQIISYLKFFEVGADLIEGEENPCIKDGKREAAEHLIFKRIGFHS